MSTKQSATGSDKEIELRDKAIQFTVEYFKEKEVSEDVFMLHLERVYNFLLTGNT